MTIMPSAEAMQEVTQVMTKAMLDLHKIIEKKCDPRAPKETMTLMMSFITGVTFMLRDKMETLKPGLGKELFDAVNLTTAPEGRKIIEQLSNNDPSLNESDSGIEPDNEQAAIKFLVEKFSADIQKYLDALPLSFRNDITVLRSLAVVAGLIFKQCCDLKDLDASINNFAKNIRDIAIINNEVHNNRAYH